MGTVHITICELCPSLCPYLVGKAQKSPGFVTAVKGIVVIQAHT